MQDLRYDVLSHFALLAAVLVCLENMMRSVVHSLLSGPGDGAKCKAVSSKVQMLQQYIGNMYTLT